MHELAITLISEAITRAEREAAGFAGLAAADTRVARIRRDIASLSASLDALQTASAAAK